MADIDAFKRMLSQGQDGDMLRFTIGNACFAAGKHDEAVEHLRAAVEFNPGYSAAWKILGRALHAYGDVQGALDAFDKGLAATEQKGDKQTAKEIAVFRKRAAKAADQAATDGDTDAAIPSTERGSS